MSATLNNPPTPAFDPEDLKVQWSRIAEPQADGYDTAVALGFASREQGHARREADGDPTILGGKVAVRNDATPSRPGLVYAPHDHPRLQAALDLLALWPEAREQFAALIDTLTICWDPNLGDDGAGGGTSNHYDELGGVMTLVNRPLGTAENLVHEMGHQKLKAIGVGLTRARRIVRNSPKDLYPSPIRHDCLRPMTAVLHAQYSFTFVCEMDVRVARSVGEGKILHYALVQLADKLPKLEFGAEILREHGQWDFAGARFMQGYFAWLDRVLSAGHEALSSRGRRPFEFRHPIQSADAAHED